MKWGVLINIFQLLLIIFFLFIYIYFSELNVASVDSRLCATVAKNIAKTIQLFCVKSEQLVGRITVYAMETKLIL